MVGTGFEKVAGTWTRFSVVHCAILNSFLNPFPQSPLLSPRVDDKNCLYISVSQDTVQVAVMLSGVGTATYSHSQILDAEFVHEEDNNYSVSYRKRDVNSRSLGKNTFAIRPTKSAHRSHKQSPVSTALLVCSPPPPPPPSVGQITKRGLNDKK